VPKVNDIDDRAWKASAAAFETPTHGFCQEAYARLHANREEEALTLLRRALRIDPENPRALSLYGYALAKAYGDYREGLRLCRLALRLAPGDAELRTNLGRVHRLRGNNGAAHRNFLDAWRHDRRHPGAASELARMGIRRRPIVAFLPRGHWCNRMLGLLRAETLRHVHMLRELPRRLRTTTS
jgi:Flp pilus assembly protein TadD